MSEELAKNTPDAKSSLTNLRDYIDQYRSPKLILSADLVKHRENEDFSGNKCFIHINGDHYELYYLKDGDLVMIELKLNEISEFTGLKKFNICRAQDFFHKIGMNLIGELKSDEIPSAKTAGEANSFPDGKDGTRVCFKLI